MASYLVGHGQGVIQGDGPLLHALRLPELTLAHLLTWRLYSVPFVLPLQGPHDRPQPGVCRECYPASVDAPLLLACIIILLHHSF
jgi:hypothetical protein